MHKKKIFAVILCLLVVVSLSVSVSAYTVDELPDVSSRGNTIFPSYSVIVIHNGQKSYYQLPSMVTLAEGDGYATYVDDDVVFITVSRSEQANAATYKIQGKVSIDSLQIFVGKSLIFGSPRIYIQTGVQGTIRYFVDFSYYTDNSGMGTPMLKTYSNGWGNTLGANKQVELFRANDYFTGTTLIMDYLAVLSGTQLLSTNTIITLSVPLGNEYSAETLLNYYWQNGYNTGLSIDEGGLFYGVIEGVGEIITTPLFGNYSIGDFASVALGLGVIVLVLKFFAGG